MGNISSEISSELSSEMSSGIGGSELETDRLVILGGQSNAVKLYTEAQTEFQDTLDDYWTTTTNVLINGATSGSAALKTSANDPDTDPWWVDDGAVAGGFVEWGPSMNTWLAAVQQESATGRTFKAIVWDQGESDFGDISSGGAGYRARYKAGLLTIFSHMRNIVGSIPIVIIPIGRRGDDVVTNTGYQTIRDVQKELAAENAYIYLTPEKYDLDDDGGAHLLDADYATLAPRVARKVLSVLGETVPGGLNGPTVKSVSRVNTSVVVGIQHDGGTNLSPDTSIQGFRYTSGGSVVPILTATKVDASTISLVLGSAPGGAEVLYYAYNVLSSTDHTKLVVDNDTIPLPLRSVTWTSISVSVAASVSASASIGTVFTDVVYNYAADSYTTGQTWSNTEATPDDGEAATAYDLFLGVTASAEVTDPIYVTASAGVPPHFYSTGSVSFTNASVATSLHKNLGNNVAHSFWMLFTPPAAWANTPIFYQCGGNNATTPGFNLRYIAASNRIRIATADGTSTGNVDVSGTTLPTTGTVGLLVFTYDPATKACKFYINAVTPTTVGTATAAKNAAAVVTTALIFNNFTASAGIVDAGLCRHVATDAEVSTLVAYLETKYSVSIV